MTDYIKQLVELLKPFKDSPAAKITWTDGQGHGFDMQLNDFSTLEIKEMNDKLFIHSDKNSMVLPMITEEPNIEKLGSVWVVRARLADSSRVGFCFKLPEMYFCCSREED